MRDFDNADVNMLLKGPVEDFSYSINYALGGIQEPELRHQVEDQHGSCRLTGLLPKSVSLEMMECYVTIFVARMFTIFSSCDGRLISKVGQSHGAPPRVLDGLHMPHPLQGDLQS